MRIGQVAEAAGVSADTIRYYERVGLLAAPTRSRNRYREYLANTVEDIQFIKKAQVLGLKLDEIREVLEIAAGGQPPCDHVRSVVVERLAEVEIKLRELRTFRSTLKETLHKLDTAPDHVDGCRCGVIETA